MADHKNEPPRHELAPRCSESATAGEAGANVHTPCDRRRFFEIAGASIIRLGALAPVARAFAQAVAHAEPGESRDGPRWAMVVDTKKCLQHDGCRLCLDACHTSHNVPAIPEPRHEIKWIWKETAEHAFPSDVSEFTAATLKGRPVPVLCNHCENPPCVRVCPTQATWKRKDGVVMMDEHRCIGCRFCVVACPYGSSSFNWVDPRPHIAKLNPEYPTRAKGVVEKCNLCEERLARGKPPACVEVCAEANIGAMIFGDLNDRQSEVSAILKAGYAIRRKPTLGTSPHVFYLV